MPVPVITAAPAGLPPALAALKTQVQQELEGLRASLLVRRPFLARVAMRLDLVAVVDDRLPTAGTNGRKIYFEARYYQAISPEKRGFVLAHEIWHCALGHFSRAQERDPQRWNIATDHEVNTLLGEDDFTVPDDAVLFPELGRRSAEEVYRALKPERLDARKPFDLHLPQILAERPPIIDPDFDPGEPGLTKREAKQLRMAAALEVRRQYGHLPGFIARELDRLEQGNVDWRAVLAAFVQGRVTMATNWSRPRRHHIHAGLYLPERRQRALGICVAIDLSGSVFAVLPRFMSELNVILGHAGLTEAQVLAFDTAIRHRASLDASSDLIAFTRKLRGGGGTSFLPVFRALADDTREWDALIILTDGHGRAPDDAPDIPVLWALTKDGEAPVPWGERLFIDKRDGEGELTDMM